MLLILIWAAVISFGIIMYVILDGFDLGIGILFPFIKDPLQRDIMISTIAPVWDGNETWLIFGAAALYAAFPVAYSTLLPTLYMPLTIMLAALIFRGVAFEFRFKTERHRIIWDFSFSLGSIVAAFTQGLVLGTFVIGYGDKLSSGITAYHWLTPFSIMTGIAVVAGYALLGSTWLIMKTVGELQDTMFEFAKSLLVIVTFFLVVVSIWTPIVEPVVRERWFTIPNFYYLSFLPMLAGIIILANFYLLFKRNEMYPFLLSVITFICGYIGFCISDWPYIIPHSVTIWEAASPPSSLIFTLIGVAILLPILLIYTIYSYSVFRGKVTEVEHY